MDLKSEIINNDQIESTSNGILLIKMFLYNIINYLLDPTAMEIDNIDVQEIQTIDTESIESIDDYLNKNFSSK